jgi:hypothetical protein
VNAITPAALQLATFLAGGVLAVFSFTMLWDFIRGLIRG